MYITNWFFICRFRQRHIAFQIQYDGRKFFGFAAQDGSGVETVENFFFQALERVNLIADRKVKEQSYFFNVFHYFWFYYELCVHYSLADIADVVALIEVFLP